MGIPQLKMILRIINKVNYLRIRCSVNYPLRGLIEDKQVRLLWRFGWGLGEGPVGTYGSGPPGSQGQDAPGNFATFVIELVETYKGDGSGDVAGPAAYGVCSKQ